MYAVRGQSPRGSEVHVAHYSAQMDWLQCGLRAGDLLRQDEEVDAVNWKVSAMCGYNKLARCACGCFVTDLITLLQNF